MRVKFFIAIGVDPRIEQCRTALRMPKPTVASKHFYSSNPLPYRQRQIYRQPLRATKHSAGTAVKIFR
jgi:hypothetical protein